MRLGVERPKVVEDDDSGGGARPSETVRWRLCEVALPMGEYRMGKKGRRKGLGIAKLGKGSKSNRKFKEILNSRT